MAAYRVGIIGLGRMASTIDDELPGWKNLPYSIAAACAASDRLEVVAGADLLPEKQEAFRQRWGVTSLYTDFREMIAETKPDLVAITTRAENHAELAVAVADMGVPMLFCEKAMACSMREADAVRDAVLRNGTVFNTGVLRRFDHTFHQVRALIESGVIGTPRVGVYSAPRTTLMHIGIHVVDTMMYLLGDPRPVAVRGELRPRDIVIDSGRLMQDPPAIFQVEFEGGAEVYLVPGGTLDYEIIGTEGAIRVENNGADVKLRQPVSRGTKWAEWCDAPAPALQPGKSPTLSVLEDLVDAYEQKRPTLGPVEVCHQATEVCLAVAESHRQGGARVELPLTDRDLYVWHV